MIMFLSNHIDWIKAVHVMAVIAWMSGMLYLPRLFVYHCETMPGSARVRALQDHGAQAPAYIMNPAMIVVWIMGLTLASLTGAWADLWLQAKLMLVLAMTGLHGYFALCVKAFARDVNRRTQRFYRIINEVPAVLIVGIVILVVVRPF